MAVRSLRLVLRYTPAVAATNPPTPEHRWRWSRCVSFAAALAVLLALALVMLEPQTSRAIPAYARRYGVECNTCHAPMPPRLNNVGMIYRRAGLRLPDSDESGKFTLKNVSATGIGDAASISAEVDAHHFDATSVTPGDNRTSLQMGEVALIAGTAIGEYYSTQLVFLPRNDEGNPEFEAAEVQANYGPPDRQIYGRAGLTQTLLWQKANEGAITLTAPIVFDEGPVGAVGTFGGFPLGVKQTLLEVGGVQSALKNGRLQSTMVSASVLNGVSQDPSSGEVGAAANHTTNGVDWMIQGAELLGDRNTLSAFYYDGRTMFDVAGSLNDRFTRYGVMASAARDRFELVGGIVGGTDKSDEPGFDSVNMFGGYAEANVEIRPHWIGVYRFDQADPNTDLGGDLRRAHTISTSAQVLDNMFFVLEYQQRYEDDTRPHDILGRIRIVY